MNQRSSFADEVFGRLGDLARETIRAQVGLTRQAGQLGRAALRGDLDGVASGKAYLEAVSREGARYWKEVGALGVDYASGLMTLGNATSARILDETVAAGSRQPRAGHDRGPNGATAHRDPDGARGAVSLHGALGEQARGSVTVANQHPRSRRVDVTPSDLRDAEGTAVGARLVATPAQVTIPAGQEDTITLSVELSPEHFAAGQRYTGTLEVSGGDEGTLDVSVDVAR